MEHESVRPARRASRRPSGRVAGVLPILLTALAACGREDAAVHAVEPPEEAVEAAPAPPNLLAQLKKLVEIGPDHPEYLDATEESTAKAIESLIEWPQGPTANREAYLNLMKLSLADLLYENKQKRRAARIDGRDWPGRAYTMIGLRRMNNLQECVESALANDVPGDLIEAGAWRGGATILMRAVLKAHGVTDRTVWVADSFEGLPPPDAENYPADRGMDLSRVQYLAVSQEEVERNFRRYGLLDDQVRFLKGWFKDTLPVAPFEKLALARLDGDLYESTMDGLVHLYPKLSPGGCLVIDDYNVPQARQAVIDYREQHGITEPVQEIDANGVFWKKP